MAASNPVSRQSRREGVGPAERCEHGASHFGSETRRHRNQNPTAPQRLEYAGSAIDWPQVGDVVEDTVVKGPGRLLGDDWITEYFGQHNEGWAAPKFVDQSNCVIEGGCLSHEPGLNERSIVCSGHHAVVDDERSHQVEHDKLDVGIEERLCGHECSVA